MQIARVDLFKPCLRAAAALALLASSVGSAAASSIPISGVLNAGVEAELSNSVPAGDLQREHWSNLPQTLTTNVFARATFGPETAMVSGQATATWNSPDSGSVSFRDYGWHVLLSQENALVRINHKLETDDWSYTFRATQDGLFTMNWDIRLASGNGFGLSGWTISWSGDGTGYTNPNPINPTESGVFEGIVHANTTYTIALQGANGDTVFAGLGERRDYSGYMDGNFSWSIASVPEPSTWAMMIVGFLGLGLLAYRREKIGCGRSRMEHLSRRKFSQSLLQRQLT
jgi:hypothetical protein